MSGIELKRIAWAGIAVGCLALALPVGIEAQTCNGRTLVNAGTIQPSSVSQTASGTTTSVQGKYYTVTVNQAGIYTFTFCSPGTANYDTWLCLLDSTFTLIAQNDDSCGLLSNISRSLSPGTYNIGISGFGSSSGSYTLAYFADVPNGPQPVPLAGNPSPVNGAWVSSATPTLSIVVVGAGTATTVYGDNSIDGGPFAAGTVVSNGQTSTYVTPALSSGAHTWAFRAHDSNDAIGATTTITFNVDTTPPVAGTVNDGTGADIDWQTSTTTISANWSGFSDPESALTFAWAIGTTPGGASIQAYVSVGAATSATNSGLSLSAIATTIYVTVRATNAAGMQTFVSTDGVNLFMAGTAVALPDATVGQAYSTSLTASFGTPPYSWVLETGAPPAGVTLASDGSLSGTPTDPGTYVFGVAAQDSLGALQRTAYKILVQPAAGAFFITSGNPVSATSLPAGRLFFSYNQTLASTGGLTPVIWRILGGTFPPGLVLDSLSGAITGFPSRAGTFTFTIGASDFSDPSQQSTAVFSMVITGASGALTITTGATLPGANSDCPYYLLLASSGGTFPVSWSVTSGTLPAGLSLDATGFISGTPTATGTFPFTLTATDAASATANLSASLTIVSGTGPLQVTPATLPVATQGNLYPVAFAASGGISGYSWSVSSGGLPPGLTLDPVLGAFTGSPTASGLYPFVVKVVDSGSPPSCLFARYEIAVLRTTTSGYAIVTPSPLPDGALGVPYSTALAVVGGSLPQTWSVFSGSLPPGLTLNTNTGEIAGTPGAPGGFVVFVEARSMSGILSSVRMYTLSISGSLGGGGGGGGGGCGVTGMEPLLLIAVVAILRRRRKA